MTLLPAMASRMGCSFMRTPDSRMAAVGWMKVRPM